MNEQDYRSFNALNYSKLSLFNKSQDHLLLGLHDRPVFRFGHIYECYLEALACNDLTLFTSKYVETELDGEIPAEIITHKGDLSELYVYNKDGKTLNAKKKRLHGWLDFMSKNKGLAPVGKYTMEDIRVMATNTLNCEFQGRKVSEWLQNAVYQKPIIWKEAGVNKKMLADAVVKHDGTTYIFDFKTTANFGHFVNMFKSSYWIQDRHYSEGAKTFYSNVHTELVFVVASKDQSLLAQCFTISEESRESAYEAYQNLVADYDAWDFEGRPTKGWKEESKIKLWF